MVDILLFIKNELGIFYKNDSFFVNVIILVLKQAYRSQNKLIKNPHSRNDQNPIENIVI